MKLAPMGGTDHGRISMNLRGLLFATWLLCGGAASAECVAPPPAPEPAAVAPPSLPATAPADTVTGQARLDHTGRVVAPVMVNGQGPFRFIVDTGANRSVLSQGLAEHLGLAPQGAGEVNTIVGVTTAPLVEVADLSYLGLDLPSAPLPVLSGPVFAGEQGLLGVDGMEGRRLLIDIERGCVEVRPSHGAPHLFAWTTIRGQLRFGHLIVMPGKIRDVPINVIIDTGSDSTLANTALRDALRAHLSYDASRLTAARAYTAGMPVVLDSAIATPRLRLGSLFINHIYAYVGDFHVFSLWGLTEEPTLLLGMDVLSHLRAVAIDYGRSIIQVQLPESEDLSLFMSGFGASRFMNHH